MTGIWQPIRGSSEPELTCRELVELVTDYLEGALTDVERTRFEVHVRECEGCANHLDQIRRTIALVGHIEVAELSEQTTSDLLAAFRAWAHG